MKNRRANLNPLALSRQTLLSLSPQPQSRSRSRVAGGGGPFTGLKETCGYLSCDCSPSEGYLSCKCSFDLTAC